MNIPRLPAEIWRLVLDSMHCIKCPFNKFGEIELLHRLNISKHSSVNSIDILENAINIHYNELALNAKSKINLFFIDDIMKIIIIIYYIREDGDYNMIEAVKNTLRRNFIYIYNICDPNHYIQIYYYLNELNIIIQEDWYSHGQLHNILGPSYIEKYDNGLLKVQMWSINGNMQSIYDPILKKYNPALKIWHSNGILRSIRWYKESKLFNENAPAILEYSENGTLIFEAWYKNGLEYCYNNPAMIEWYDDGKLKSHKWCINGKVHRIGNPALIRWNNDEIVLEEWYIDNKLHRLDGPASIRYTKTNDIIIKSEVWYKEGMVHRLDGPAVIEYHNDIVNYTEWFEEDRAIHL